MKPLLEINLADFDASSNISYKDKLKETLGQMAVADQRNVLVFCKYGLDYSFRGKYTLEQACEEKKISMQQVENDLDLVKRQPRIYNINYSDWSPDYLVDFIITNHHGYVRKFLLLLTEEFNHVSIAIQLKYPFIALISEIFQHIASDMSACMMEEEQVLFPYIRFLVQAKKGNLPASCLPDGCLEHRMAITEIELQIVGENMAFIRKLTNNYTLPDGTSSACILLFQWLNDFDNDLQQHVHIENNILFHKAIKLEKECLRRSNRLQAQAKYHNFSVDPRESLL